MESRDQLTLMIVVFTALFFLVVFLVVILMVVNSNNRQKHKTKVAELELNNIKEINAAEREATAQTMAQIGRELHDNVGQLLTVSKIGVDMLVRESSEPDKRLTESLSAIKDSIREVRRLGHSLNTDLWNERSLQKAIEEEAARLEHIGACKVHLNIDGVEASMESDTKIVLYRTFQEIMNNALKHSQAEKITVSIKHHDLYIITITDDGVGFDESHIHQGAGLKNIKRRCELIGFNAELKSSPQKGCTWSITQLSEHERT